METNIYLIRHGLTVWNKEKRLQGHHDTELHEMGEKQAEDLAEYFVKERIFFSHIYSSDLKRAKKTAEAIAKKQELIPQLTSTLRERNMGEWAGRKIEEIKSEYPNWLEIRETGGLHGIEKTEDLANRMLKTLENIICNHSGEHIAVVSHGGAINSVLTFLSNGSIGIGKTVIENTSITHVRVLQSWDIVSTGETPHLTPTL